MPLVIAAVGLLAGSIAGACFGFAAGLFLDLALVQTVGLSSLVYVAVGYWAGRFRELRDPQSALVPLAVGAAATAAAMVGYSLMQFLLGVDAPVSFLLAREILATVLLNGVIAHAGLRGRAPRAAARPARGPAPAPAPGLHDRRPLAALARMIDPGPQSTSAAAADHAAARAARRRAGRHRLRALRDHLLPPVVPAGAVGRPVPPAGARQPRARAARAGAARRHPRPQRPRARREPRRHGRPARSREPARRRARRGRDVGPARDRALAPAQGQEGPAGPDPAARHAAPRRRASRASRACWTCRPRRSRSASCSRWRRCPTPT